MIARAFAAAAAAGTAVLAATVWLVRPLVSIISNLAPGTVLTVEAGLLLAMIAGGLIALRVLLLVEHMQRESRKWAAPAIQDQIERERRTREAALEEIRNEHAGLRGEVGRINLKVNGLETRIGFLSDEVKTARERVDRLGGIGNAVVQE